jgi:hypothetical protein
VNNAARHSAPALPRTLLALAVAVMTATLAPAALAQAGNAELLEELRQLRERVNQLEARLKAQESAKPATPQPGQWGMTPEQARELNRLAVKTEALQDNFEEQGFKGLKISGQMDPTFIWNRASDESGFVFLNGNRYTYDNSYLGMLVLDIEKETESGARWRLTLAPERGTGAVFGGSSIVHEATVSIPLTDNQTRLWLGQIPDWTGYEYTLPKENKFITHNLLFDLTAPAAFTGAALDVTRGKWWSRVGFASVDSARYSPRNRQPAFVYRVDYSRGEFQGFGFTGLHGKLYNAAADGEYLADPSDPYSLTPFAEAGQHTMTHMLEFDAYFVRGDWSVFGQVSWGRQKNAALFNSDGQLRDASWLGYSATVAYKITPRLEALLRVDYLRNSKNGGGLYAWGADDGQMGVGRGFNRDGSFYRGEDVGANRNAISIGTNYLFDENTILKFEYRRDGATQPVFVDARTGQGLKVNQMLGASVVVFF